MLKSVGFFGSMDAAQIEEAKTYFDKCWDSCNNYMGVIAEFGIQKGLKRWSTIDSDVEQFLNDERVGPIALLTILGLTADSFEAAKVLGK